MHRLLSFIFFFVGTFSLQAQPRTGFAYYDVDLLCDTIPSLFYDDARYTPKGRLHWTGERYRAKVARVAEVIAELEMPLVGLYGVENEAVVRDVVQACGLPYSYVHRTLNSLDGMDFALLYYGDRLLIRHVEAGYGYLCIEGRLDGKPLAILLTRGDRFAAEILEELREKTPAIRVIVAGKLESGATGEKFGLADILAPAERQGRGNACRKGGWYLQDRLLIDRAFTLLKTDIFVRRELLDPRSGDPLPTYRGQTYAGGAGRYLPLFLYFK